MVILSRGVLFDRRVADRVLLMAEVEGCRLSPRVRVREQDAQVSLAVISTVVAVAGATAVLALS